MCSTDAEKSPSQLTTEAQLDVLCICDCKKTKNRNEFDASVFFDLSESSNSFSMLDFRKHELPAFQISCGLILHEFPNCSSRD